MHKLFVMCSSLFGELSEPAVSMANNWSRLSSPRHDDLLLRLLQFPHTLFFASLLFLYSLLPTQQWDWSRRPCQPLFNTSHQLSTGIKWFPIPFWLTSLIWPMRPYHCLSPDTTTKWCSTTSAPADCAFILRTPFPATNHTPAQTLWTHCSICTKYFSLRLSLIHISEPTRLSW